MDRSGKKHVFDFLTETQNSLFSYKDYNGVSPKTQYTHVRNKKSNTQGGAPNVAKVILHT